MGGVLIVASINEEGILHNSVASLVNEAQSLGAFQVVSLLPINSLLQLALAGAGVGKIYAPEAKQFLTVKQKAQWLKKIIEKESLSEIWLYQNRELSAYLGGVLNACVYENVGERKADGSLKSEIFTGKFLYKQRISKAGISVVSFSSVVGFSAKSVETCTVSILPIEGTQVRKVGDFIVSDKQEGVKLPEARVILDVGDGLGAKGIPAIKKIANIMRVMGVKVAIGGTRVVTDAGRLPRDAQIGVSGIAVFPDLIISVGVSGAPQHWSGMQKAKYKVCINIDANAPLMKMCDYPILGDGHIFLKDFTEQLVSVLTVEQKEQLQRAPQVKKTEEPSSTTQIATTHLEHLNDLPLNVDKRSIYFEAFEVYKFQELSEYWDVEKMKGLVERMAKFSEKVVNQGKRDAERQGILFRPGEEFKEKSVLAPKSYHKAWEEYYKAGFGRLATPRALGGLELPHGMIDYIIEIASAGSPALGTYFGLTQGAALIVTNFGNDWMKEHVLPGLINGRFQGTMCLTEAQAGSDLAAVNCIATRIEKSDTFELTGTKVFITSGDHDITENHWHIVLAKIPGTGLDGTRAISLFLVPKFWVNEDGNIVGFNDVETQSIEHKSGMMTSPTCVLKFTKSKGFLIANNVDEEIRAPSGMKKMFFFMNAMRHETGTAGRGQAVATCLDALVYSNERKQGVAIKDLGNKKVQQSEIIHHGNQKKLLLDMFARTMGDRALTQKLTEVRDRAHHAFDIGMVKFKEGIASLAIDAEQDKQLKSLMGQIEKVEKQISKAREGVKRVRKDQAELQRITTEKNNLTKLKEELKKQILGISPSYWHLQSLKKKLKKDREDQEAYASILTSLVKAQVTDDNVRTLIDGMQAYGGIGFMAETPVAQRLHDSQILCIWEGTNDIQSLNTVFRQIGSDVRTSDGQVVFVKVMSEIEAFLNKYNGHYSLKNSIELLKRYVKELCAFRNAMTVTTWRDKIAFMRETYGYQLSPSKEEMIKAKMQWGMAMQVVARPFNTYFAHTVQAWQLLRIAVLAAKRLREKQNGVSNDFDYETYDEKFLEGRILIARHFISSPDCMDKNLFCWREFFFDNVAMYLEYDHLADKPNRITMA